MYTETFVRLALRRNDLVETLPLFILRRNLPKPCVTQITAFKPNVPYLKEDVVLQLDQLYLRTSSDVSTLWNASQWQLIDPFLYIVEDFSSEKGYDIPTIVAYKDVLHINIQETKKGWRDNELVAIIDGMDITELSGFMTYPEDINQVSSVLTILLQQQKHPLNEQRVKQALKQAMEVNGFKEFDYSGRVIEVK